MDSAIDEFNQVIRLKANFAEAFNDRGAALIAKNEAERAIADYTAAIRFKPDYAEAHYSLGNVLFQTGQLP